ncbi:MAG: STAS domain-containing protein, partial [Gemmatimonadetes bacterium]|nr:STAS domain-containing protein [Gemmatimonadota bacterium]
MAPAPQFNAAFTFFVVFALAGSITIARAASTAREIAAEPDPLTIDLSDVERMDTVGAWLVYRTVRDRNAKVVGASEESQSLLDQVAEAAGYT